MAEHRVEFVQLARAAAQVVDAQPGDLSQLGELGVALRQELVERRIEQTDRHRKPRHLAENARKIGALFGKQFR